MPTLTDFTAHTGTVAETSVSLENATWGVIFIINDIMRPGALFSSIPRGSSDRYHSSAHNSNIPAFLTKHSFLGCFFTPSILQKGVQKSLLLVQFGKAFHSSVQDTLREQSQRIRRGHRVCALDANLVVAFRQVWVIVISPDFL